MATDHDDQEIRRYLLGELEEEPGAALERDYFARAELFDRVWAAEHDIVNEYLDGRLSAQQRDRFERHYLAQPGHQDRVAVARELRSLATALASSESRSVSAPPVASRRALPAWRVTIRAPLTAWPTVCAAVAATLLVLAVGAMWTVRSSSRPEPPLNARAPESPRPAESPTPAAQTPTIPVTLAVTLSAINLRGIDDLAGLTVPQGTDLVVLHLEGDRAAPRFERGRAVVRTISGKEVWAGPALSDSGTSGSLARVDVPAAKLTPDDYILTLLETGASGTESERYRYFLRVHPH